MSAAPRNSTPSQAAYCVWRDFNASPNSPWLIVAPERLLAERLWHDLRFFSSDDPERVLLFQRWEVLPFDQISPSPEVMGERITAMMALCKKRAVVVVTTIDAMMHRSIDPEILRTMILPLSEGQDFDRDHLIERLVGIGYCRSSVVEELGQFAVRGSVIDLFSPGSSAPLRIEFFGDEIESLRFFDSQSQRSIEKLSRFDVLPAREFAFDAQNPDKYNFSFGQRIKERGEQLGLSTRVIAELLEQLESGTRVEGLEHLLPLVVDSSFSLLEIVAPETKLVTFEQDQIEGAAENFSDLVQQRIYKAEENGQLYPEPDSCYLRSALAVELLNKKSSISFTGLSFVGPDFESEDQGSEFSTNALLKSELVQSRRSNQPFKPLINELRASHSAGIHVGIVVGSKARRNRVEQILAEYRLPLRVWDESFVKWRVGEATPAVDLFYGDISEGFFARNQGFKLIAEREIFPDVVAHGKSRTAATVKRFAGKLANLNVDDFIVHIDHGIGIYRGLKQLTVQGRVSDFLELEYAEGSKLYLPVENIAKVQKYCAAEGVKPNIHRLGGNTWSKAKRKVKAQVAELAGELLRLYAKREMSEGESYGEVTTDDFAFADTFEYEPTPDQAKAIEDVFRDLSVNKPMDRLICGDVGYGKTEVAMRAAFKVVNGGRQVAVLVPTTILADQHYRSFKERFAQFPFEVRGMSRFFSAQENKETAEMLRRGTVDVVIGTHRLLSKDIVFKDLGLVVIDEEHRFGVTAKEKLKRLRTAVDVLTLTATPIPRTLHMSMVGIKDLSIIETPPVDRQAIRTYIVRMDEAEDNTVREAILRELGRAGQVFYIHNRVQSIASITNALRELVPEARIEFAHGQMKEQELERVMNRFIKHEFDVLVSTTIVESGLDIPNANTIIIRQAERFGLAELYQLRGRVGRSSRRAYAFLLVSNPAAMTRDAKKRLEVLQALDDLGIGFRLALQDMEIRGAGNLLGKDQSGQISLIGFELYMKLLQETVEALRGEGSSVTSIDIEPEIQIGFPAHIPPEYIPDVAERIFLYQRLVGLQDLTSASYLTEEIEDRFGRIPQQVEELIEIMTFRALLRRGVVLKAYRSDSKLRLSFHPEARLDIDRLKAVVKKSGSLYRLIDDRTVQITIFEEVTRPWDLIEKVVEFFESIGINCNNFKKTR